MSAALEVSGVEMRFAGLVALADISFSVEPGERRAIIGPNGAGKTTLFNIISGQLRATRGQVRCFGRELTRLPPEGRARLGLGRTFQRNNLFLNLRAWENVRLAVQVRRGVGRRLWRPALSYTEINAETDAILARVGLTEAAGVRAADLSYGFQRQLEIGLALAIEPKVLLLDEPTAGMSPAETARMTELLANLPRATTLLVIEHDMDVVAALADKITVLHYGRMLADGPAAAVRADPQVLAVYLGTAEEMTTDADSG